MSLDMPIRPRRMRKTEQMRRLVRETNLMTDDLICPIFVVAGNGIRQEIRSMPGVYHISVDCLDRELEDIKQLGIPGVILFGIPDSKDDKGSGAYAENSIISQAIKRIKAFDNQMLVITDVCLCEYTTHGHCGLLKGNEIDNDSSVALIAETALSYARAGADIVAPSDMMDGRVKVIRNLLDKNEFHHVPIMAYSAKYASVFYGPFREAVQSAPVFGDRKGYQLDPANAEEAMREIAIDIEEGADIIMVKPAMAYLDIIRLAKDRYRVPLAAYNVSGEYSMIKAAAAMGWIDEKKAVAEMLVSIKRAGADIIITYFAKDYANMIRTGG